MKRACLVLRSGKCSISACLPILFGGMAQKLYKITFLKGDICKDAKSMLKLSGMFIIAIGVS